MTRIKICGITNIDDAIRAAELGTDAIGFVFSESPRRIEPETARTIALALPPFITRVGVFVNENTDVVRNIIDYCRLDAVQLHKYPDNVEETPFQVPIIRAFQVNTEGIFDQIKKLKADYFLMDTYDGNLSGGTGRSFDWNIARRATEFGKVILAGGLNHLNITNALTIVRPYAVDVSSGVEIRGGQKDHKKMQLFIKEVRNWDSRIN